MPTKKTSVHLTGLDIILVSDLQHKMVVVMVIVSTQIDGITGSPRISSDFSDSMHWLHSNRFSELNNNFHDIF